MRPVAPRLPNCEEITLGNESDHYATITVAVRPNAFVPGIFDMITRWRPTEEERARIAAGEDVYVSTASRDGLRMAAVYVTLAEAEGG